MTLQFEKFYDWTKSELNLQLDGYKQRQLQRRITTIMKKSGATDLASYAEKIKNDAQIRNDFLDYITINVTEFFRNKDIFADFETVLTDELPQKFPELKIWSAACSTGAEAYSMAIALKKKNLDSRAKIIGTDLDLNILEKARKGIYRDADVKNVEAVDLQRFFKADEPFYHLSDDIKKLVEFKKHDLIVGKYDKGYHVILCRNVTIYFNDEVKDDLYQKMSDALVPGGIFFIGATETIYNPDKYGLRKIGSFLYEKIE